MCWIGLGLLALVLLAYVVLRGGNDIKRSTGGDR